MRKCRQTSCGLEAELGSGVVSEPVSLGIRAGVGVRRRRERCLWRRKLGASSSLCMGWHPAVMCDSMHKLP